MLGQCWADVIDGEPTLNQHWFNVSCLLGLIEANRYRCSDVDSMLVQRLRRWPSIESTLGRVLRFAG